MGEYNTCEWLVVARLEKCGRQCVNNLCGIHRAQLRRRPVTEPYACRECGKGTKSASRLCSKACGSDRVQKTLRRAGRKAVRVYPKVMKELLSVTRML